MAASVPGDFDSVRKLPGIGLYTAGAIMSVAFNADYPAPDANAGRILARVFDIAHPSGSKEFAETVWRVASDTLPPGGRGDFNPALMDLGSIVCLSNEPSCAKCPLSCCCAAFRKGLIADRPVKARKKTVRSPGRPPLWLRMAGSLFEKGRRPVSCPTYGNYRAVRSRRASPRNRRFGNYGSMNSASDWGR